jgi:hypothetical protein
VIQRRAASLAVLAAMLGASATAAPLTPPQLPTTGAVQPADLMLVWPTSTQGPLKSIAWSVVLSQMEASLGSVYLQSTNNLADVGSVATARTNLGLGSASVLNTGTSGAALCPLNVGCTWSGKQTIGASTSAGALFNLTPGVAPSSPANGDLWTTASGLFAEINGTTVGPFVSVTAGGLLASNNLSDVASAATSRANLGVTATGADTTYAYRANNLSDLASIVTARTNLGLGGAAVLNVGTASGTVAAGNDSRFAGPTQNSQAAAYGLVASDAGEQVYHPSSDTTPRTWTIPANASVPYLVGTKIELVNDCGAGAITLSITSDTLEWFPSGGVGSRTLAACSIATLTKISATKWALAGPGVS